MEGTFRAHQVPLANVRENPEHLAMLEAWMRSYEPEHLFDDHGALVEELSALAPTGLRRMGSNPHTNGGMICQPLDLPAYGDYSVDLPGPGTVLQESTRCLGAMLRDVFTRNAEAANFRLFCPDETRSNRLGAVFEVENRCTQDPVLATDDHEATDGRVMEVLSEHNCEGWLEGYVLTGRHGLFATYEAFAMVSASMTVQHTKWLEASRELDVARPDPLAERPADVDVLAQRSQRLQPPRSRAHRHDAVQAGIRRPDLPPARCELPPVGRRPLSAKPRLREPDRDRQAASAPVARPGGGR